MNARARPTFRARLHDWVYDRLDPRLHQHGDDDKRSCLEWLGRASREGVAVIVVPGLLSERWGFKVRRHPGEGNTITTVRQVMWALTRGHKPDRRSIRQRPGCRNWCVHPWHLVLMRPGPDPTRYPELGDLLAELPGWAQRPDAEGSR